MKKTIISMMTIAATVILAGCQQKLSEQHDDRIDSMKSVYEYLARTYDNLNKTFWEPVFQGVASGVTAGGYMMSGYCDEAQEVDQTTNVNDWYTGKVSAASDPLFTSQTSNQRWDGLYKAIGMCNTALYYLEGDEINPEYSDELRQGFIAQYYALRAYCYLQLVKRWGGVPIVSEPYFVEADHSKDRRASFAEVVDYILEQCDKALAANPKLTWFAGAQTSAPSLFKGTLMAIKSQAALYAASPLWADDCSGTQKYTWERAAEITRASLDSLLKHSGKLVTEASSFPNESASGINAYDKYFLSSYPLSLSWDTETIYQPYIYGHQRSVLWQYNGLPVDVGQKTAGCCPTQEMVDAYEVLSEDGTKAVPLLVLSSPYKPDGTPNINPEAAALGYVDCSDRMYSNRDPRFYASIYYNGSEGMRNGETFVVETFEDGNCGINLSPVNKRNTCTGYYLRKFINLDSGTDNGNKDGYLRQFRLAELYLNFAEASAMAYGPDVAVKGMTAREAVNTVRSRVGMPGITDDGEDFILRLRNERRVELAFEEHRFFDVRRWCTPSSDLKSTDALVSGMMITRNQDGTFSYERIHFERQCWNTRFLKYPIPLAEVRRVLALTGEDWQNSGWN